MVTKLSMSGNRVLGYARDRGIALISVVSVLVLLALIATPFLVTMRDSKSRGENFLYSARADWEAESLFELTRAHLTSSLQHIERRRLDELGFVADSGSRPPDNATPTSDTLSEFELPEELLARFNKLSAREQRVWDVEITDLQSKLNLNGCSFPVLANILGRSEIADEIGRDDTNIAVTDASVFPPEGGVVRIGSEVVKYGSILGNALSDCERGYRSELPENGGPGEYQPGDSVILEAAFQIATRPFRAREGAYVRYTNPYQARTISEQGVAALSALEFDRLRPFITAWNGNVVGDGWSNPQVVRNGVTPGDASQLYVNLKNPRYFGAGTIVRLTDGVNSDYAVVTKVRGTNQVLLAGKIEHSYDADQARLYSLARSPVNVNTASVRMLAVIFEGVRKRGIGTGISAATAGELAAYIKTFTVRGEDGASPDGSMSDEAEDGDASLGQGAGVYRNWEDFIAAIDSARQFGVNLSDDEREAIIKNAMNANDSTLEFSTVPFCFQSFDMYEVRATAAIMDQTGRELARRELRRVIVASTTKSGTYVVQTQNDFQNQIMKSRDGKWFTTYPNNVNAQYDYGNIPASEYFAYAQKSRFPDTDPATAVGDVRLLPAAFRYANRNVLDRVYHFDQTDLPDGQDLVQQSFDVGVDGPYNVRNKLADLVRFIDVDGFGTNIEMGLRDFSLSFWYKPGWSRGEGNQVIFDYGLDDDHTNRVSLTYDGARDMLVLAVADATRERRSREVFYNFDHTTWLPTTWYHIAVHVGGSHASQLELFVDGEKQGLASGITRLTTSVPPTGLINQLSVEDARSFPESGVVIVHGQNGSELFEYSRRTEGALTISRRKARNIDHLLDQTELRNHESGAVVELYGFAGPLLTDIRSGGAVVQTAFGPFRVYRFNYTGDTLEDQNATSARFIRGLADSASASTQAIPGVRLTEFTTGSNSSDILDDLGGQGAQGLAMIISNSARVPPIATTGGGGSGGGASPGRWQIRGGSVNGTSNEQQSSDIGGVEIVRYSVVNASSGEIQIEQRHVQLPGVTVNRLGADNLNRFMPTYSFGDTTRTDATFGLAVQTQGLQSTNGAYTAFIPIGFVAGGAANADYLKPAIEEQHVGGVAYVQVDSEWFEYDTLDTQIVPQRVAFLRTRRLQEVQALFAMTIARPLVEQQIQRADSPRRGSPGGSGGTASGQSAPPIAVDANLENDAPTEPQTGSSTTSYLNPTADGLDAFRIAQMLRFRGMELRNENREFRIANTIPNDHAASEDVIACFRVTHGNSFERTDDPSMRGAYPGFNDLLTLRDTRFNDEYVRVQWGYKGWVGLTLPTVQTWLWDRPNRGDNDLRRYDSRSWSRVLKFPSGELPDAGLTTQVEKLRFGVRYDANGGTSPAIIDEVFFPNFTHQSSDRPNYVLLGDVPQELIQQQTQQNNPNQVPIQPTFNGIDETTDQIPSHMIYFIAASNAFAPNGLPIDQRLFPTDGGIIRIDDELILFSDFDASRGLFTGCQRGTFGTLPKRHEYGAVISGIHSFPTSRLTSGADPSSASFQLQDAFDFPDDGYLRIADAAEVIGYTQRLNNALSGPLGRIDPDETSERDTADARVGGGIFRGRFGTVPEGYSVDDIAIALPFRQYDRYAEYSDDAENSYVQLSWTKPGAVWKRITWSDVPVQFVEVLALVRFSGGPEWDSDAVIRVGQEPMPLTDRRKFLYEITDPTAKNLLNVEADRVEVRLLVRFARGAYDRFANVAPDYWKESPWIQKVVVEFVAPPSVIYEDK